MRRKYRRHQYKKRGSKIQGFKFLQNKKFVQIWYWGVHGEYGKVFCAVRTDDCPHYCIRARRKGTGYIGFDYERHRFVIRPWNDGPKKRLRFGWRYRVYG